uniref:Peptidase C1A papain C-terminal domain-containing protein n=1 Tax=Acrobeloides nanus TaxID=290746 RepID=A0A914C0L2_9BILA
MRNRSLCYFITILLLLLLVVVFLILGIWGISQWFGGEISDNQADVFYSESYKRAAEIVKKLNLLPNSTWEARLNPSAIEIENQDRSSFVISNDSLGAELQTKLEELDGIVEGSEFREHYKRHVKILSSVEGIPTEFHASDKWPECTSLTEVLDQGGCGSCWAMAAVSVIGDRMCIASSGLRRPKISAQQLIECCYYCGGCNGTMDPLTPFIYWFESGIVTESCYPYTIATDCGYPCLPETFYPTKGLGKCRKNCVNRRERFIRNYAKYVYKIASLKVLVNQATLYDVYTSLFGKNITSLELVKLDLMTFGPVVLCFNVFESFLHYYQGIYNKNMGIHVYDHCVKIIGWNHDGSHEYLLAVNSWSPKWAFNGTFKIDLEMLHNFRSDFYAGVPI